MTHSCRHTKYYGLTSNIIKFKLTLLRSHSPYRSGQVAILYSSRYTISYIYYSPRGAWTLTIVWRWWQRSERLKPTLHWSPCYTICLGTFSTVPVSSVSANNLVIPSHTSARQADKYFDPLHESNYYCDIFKEAFWEILRYTPQ